MAYRQTVNDRTEEAVADQSGLRVESLLTPDSVAPTGLLLDRPLTRPYIEGRIGRYAMAEVVTFTAAEVAFVLREPVKAIKKAFDEGPVQAKLVKKPGGTVRAV